MVLKPKIRASIVTTFFFLLCFFLVVWFTEAPINLSRKISPGNCAALAIRDNVSSFEKFGSRLFTCPNLRCAYSEIVYLTEYSTHEKHEAFVSHLNELLSRHKYVDIFLLAHSNEYYRWVMEIDSVKRERIRLVYNTGCSGADQKDIWLRSGVQSYVGHQSSESVSPVFYFYFLRRWCAGEKLSEAVVEANQLMKDKLHRLHISIDPVVLEGSQANVFGMTDLTVDE